MGKEESRAGKRESAWAWGVEYRSESAERRGVWKPSADRGQDQQG